MRRTLNPPILHWPPRPPCFASWASKSAYVAPATGCYNPQRDPRADVAELADALDLGSSRGNPMGVRLSPSAPITKEKEMTRKLFLAACAAATMIAVGVFAADTKPKTVIHVIAIKWKADATPAQIEKAIKGAEALPSQYPGITHVWTRPIKKQLPEGYSHVIVMEFANEDALKNYADSPAQKKW